ncbi:MAG: enoyl-CoA hydratase [Gammaproteobacteria bacterium]|nr:enoyl-CoA hydratase [Gammaproteobacteria bacterium]
MNASSRIGVAIEGRIARVVIDNPARRNAVSFAMWGALADALERLAGDDEVRVVVLTGAGDRAFSAGNDISEFGEWRSHPERLARYNETSARACRALRLMPRPTIARIRGVCVGGGFELAQLCDIAVAAEDARFAVTPARLGLGYKLEDVELLVERIGARAARELLYTARMFDAAEAMRLGLVNRIVPVGELDACVDGYAADIAANAPLSVHAAKSIIAEATKPDGMRDRALCQALVDACHRSDDYQEGQRAFAEKRPPVFRGR